MDDTIVAYIDAKIAYIKADTLTSMGEDMVNSGRIDAMEDIKLLIETLKQETK